MFKLNWQILIALLLAVIAGSLARCAQASRIDFKFNWRNSGQFRVT
jgi:hypothetical protein